MTVDNTKRGGGSISTIYKNNYQKLSSPFSKIILKIIFEGEDKRKDNNYQGVENNPTDSLQERSITDKRKRDKLLIFAEKN